MVEYAALPSRAFFLLPYDPPTPFLHQFVPLYYAIFGAKMQMILMNMLIKFIK